MAVSPRLTVPASIYKLPFGERVRWARMQAGLSHDQLALKMGRSNRGHLIAIEKGRHLPLQSLRDAIAEATGAPRDLFAQPPAPQRVDDARR